jgi:toxin ParE1/3/4
MIYTVRMTSGAWRDLEEIYQWIAENDSPASADYVLDRLTEIADSIAALPSRRSRPKELPPRMAFEYRQVFFKPYRVTYQVLRNEVVIHLVADGRRNLQSLLLRRLRIDVS